MTAFEAQEDLFFLIHLSPEVAARFEEFTTLQVGRPVSLMACGRPLIEAVVREPISSGQMIVGPFAAPAQAAIRDCLGLPE